MKKSKIISLILVTIILISTIIPVLQAKVYAESYAIEYKGSITYKLSTVGKFFIDGRHAFCIDHKKTTPGNGITVTDEIYNDDNVLKCLYYGLGGDETWYFDSEEQAIVYTTLALDHFVNGNKNTIAQEFIDYINSREVPKIILEFSKNSLNAYQISDNIQKTEEVTIRGNSRYYLTIPLQKGVTLVNRTRGTEETGNVNVYGGDTFYLKAPLNINGTWETSDIKNNRYKYQPIIYKTSDDSYQRLASGYKVLHTDSIKTNFSVNWLSTGSFEIHKKDEATGQAISDTRFEVINTEGIVVDTITTNVEGYAKSRNLLVGKYILKEVSANGKYIMNNEPIEIVIMPGETKTIDITNKHKEGRLKIVKVDSRDNKIPIPNVTFEIWNEETNEKIATETTKEDGTITINNLRTGTYKVKEISTNEWYELDSKTNTVEIQWNKTTQLKVENDIKTGYIEIIKKDADYSDIKLENVKFEIRNSKGIVVDKLITNKSGYAKSKPLPIDETYEVKEIETTYKYILSSSIENVKFTPKEDIKKLNITNKHKQGNIKVIKIDSDNNKIVLGGVKFELYSEEFKKVIGTYTTNNNGEIFIENLRIGNYKLKEISTNKWYNLADEIEVIVEQNKTNQVIVKNELKKGQIKVIKVDKENNEIKIPNVIFEVQDNKGNVLEKIITNENGEAITQKYSIRDYEKLKLHEIQTDKLYELNDKILEIELNEDKITQIIVENEKIQGQIKIVKISSEDNQINGQKAGSPIQNVKFEVYSSNKELVDTIITNEEGVALTKKLYKGEYIVKEVETAEEYILNNKEFLVEINKHNEIVEIEITNEPKKPEIKKLPRTGF